MRAVQCPACRHEIPAADINVERDVVFCRRCSRAAALGFGLFWNGIVSVFVCVALSGTLFHLGITPPSWFPSPEMNDQRMSLGEVLFLWLFLTPFIAVGTGIIVAFVSAIAGKTEVRQQSDHVSIFVGVGSLGWTRKVPTPQVATVKTGQSSIRSEGSPPKATIEITLQNGKSISFGSWLPEERRRYLMSAVQTLIAQSPQERFRPAAFSR